MAETPRDVIESVLQTVCGASLETLRAITSGGLHETYRAALTRGGEVIVRIARRNVPWFANEAEHMSAARAVGVPTPEVLGVQHREHEGALLSFSVLSCVRGRALSELTELGDDEVETHIANCGELLARLHAVPPVAGRPHRLARHDDLTLERAGRTAHDAWGRMAGGIVDLGAEHLAQFASDARKDVLAHGDWLPKHIFVEGDEITGVIDWEFAGPADRAHDLARWEISAGEGFDDYTDVLFEGYERVTQLDDLDHAWISASAIHWAIEVLGWRNPASPERIRRCVEVIARHTDPAAFRTQ